jgi:uncharacterized membrane protein YgcG
MKRFRADRRTISPMASGATFMAMCALAIAGALGIAGLNTSHAEADSRGPDAWIVDDAAGNVEMQPASGASWVSLRPGAVVPGPATIRTGPGSSATLIRDADRIVLSASTEVQLPSIDHGDPATRIVQTKGDAFFEVGPRPGWSFSVDTPYLAVVVKGTKFGVGVSGAGTSVSVSEGRVQVDRPDGGSADVSAGETARSGSAPGSDISVSKSSAKSAAAPEAAPSPQGATTASQSSSPSRSDAAGGRNGNSNNGSGGNSGNGNSGNGNGNSGNGNSNGGNGNSNDNSGNGNGNGNSGNSGNGHGNNGKGHGNSGNGGNGKGKGGQ